MIIAVALCPAPPLLIRELTGADPAAPELRSACLDAVTELTASAPEVVAVVGTAEETAQWDGGSTLDPAVFAPRATATGRADVALAAGGPLPSPDLPPSLGVGAWLLSRVGYLGDRVLQSVAGDEPADRCAEIGAKLAASRDRVCLLVMADGSARRTLRAPGYLDERSAGFDAAVEGAIRAGRLGALLSVDAGLARDLMATGRPAWQALAGAAAGQLFASEIRYCDDPFGVAYLVASLRIAGGERQGDRDV
jgi:hypothetical protein